MPIPIPSAQQMKAKLALVIIEASIAPLLLYVTDKKSTDQIAKISKWAMTCYDIANQKKMVSGAKRDLESTLPRLAPHIDATMGMSAEDEFRRWAEIFFVGLTLSYDVQATCPLYGKSREWGYLDTTAETLGRMLLARHPGCDEAGTSIYMALHGYEWDTAEPQQMKEAA